MRLEPVNDSTLTSDRLEVEQLAAAVQAATSETVELAYVDAGYTGDAPAAAAQAHGFQLSVVKLPAAKRGFAWVARFRRLTRNYERLATTLAGYHFLAFSCLMLSHFIHLISSH